MIVVVAAWAVVTGAFLVLRLGSSGVTGPTQTQMANALGSEVMRNLGRGHVPSVSGEITLVPGPFRYMAENWDLTSLESGDPDTFSSHSAPWAHLARVPLLFWGTQLEANENKLEEPVDLTQLAPTYARILGMEDFKADGRPLPGLRYESGAALPRAIVTVVIDGGGWNLLDEHPDAWPTISRLMDAGANYTNAITGTAPSITAPIHATLGSGFYPVKHGIPTNPAWNIPDLRTPTVSELWDEANDNNAVVAATAFHGTHLGMIGRGDNRIGGDADLAALWQVEQSRWFARSAYELPEYLTPTDLDTLAAYEEDLDDRDGTTDEKWFGHTLEELREPVVRPASAAFPRFHMDATLEIFEREGIGQDEVTDFLWVEMKMPDYAGHQWNMVTPEVGDVLAEVDSQIARLKKAVQRVTGRDGFILALTADHGQEPFAETTDGWRVNRPELERDLIEEFGDAVEAVASTEVHLDMGVLEEEGIDVDEITGFIGAYTIQENVPSDQDVSLVPEDRLDEPLFAGAFSTEFLRELRADDIKSFGDSDYEEGNLFR